MFFSTRGHCWRTVASAADLGFFSFGSRDHTAGKIHR